MPGGEIEIERGRAPAGRRLSADDTAHIRERASLVKVFAHRGGRAWAPENTMAAFKRALEARVDGIELDVQRAASGELVVFHDADLSRTTNGVGPLADASYDELLKLSAGGWFSDEFAGEKVPLLADVLALVDGACTLNIEVKNAPVAYNGIEEELLALLEDYPHKHQVIISSFDHHVLKRLSSLGSTCALALLMDGILLDLPGALEAVGASFYHPCLGSCREDVVELCHSVGVSVNGWTANNRSLWLSALKMGLDGIVSDEPEALLRYLGR